MKPVRDTDKTDVILASKHLRKAWRSGDPDVLIRAADQECMWAKRLIKQTKARLVILIAIAKEARAKHK